MKPASNFVIVIFGASGDLSKRKLIPSIYHLYKQSYLIDSFSVLGVGRKPMDDNSFREAMASFSDIRDDEFLSHLHYLSMDTTDVNDYGKLKDCLGKLDNNHQGFGNFVYYLSTPPSLYATIAKGLALNNLHKQDVAKGVLKKIIVEKPFGYDLSSALELNKALLAVFTEDQVYRIDHYLGKETVQNIMVTRFANGIFEPMWNRNFIDHIQITSAEDIGVEDRGGYYDNSGAMRDMIQNHLMQVLAMVTMEPPAKSDSKAIRNETLKVFQSIRPFTVDDIYRNIIRGQYISSNFRGKQLNSYLQESDVASDSKTETFVALKLHIDNWRWYDVPIFIRTGKRMPTKVTEVVIQFKDTPNPIFRAHDNKTHEPNRLIIRIQPEEGIVVRFGMKVPGAGFKVQDVNMDFRYDDLGENELPSAYERLLLDCLNNDSTLYTRGDALEETWKLISPVLDAWKNDEKISLYKYFSGTWGPIEATQLILQSGSLWRNPCKGLTNECICSI